jgi:hypothetical protein
MVMKEELILDCEIGRKSRAGLQDGLGTTSYKKTSSQKDLVQYEV